jgi:hypothetical protein
VGQKTHEQNVIEIKAKLSALKDAYYRDLLHYVDSVHGDAARGRDAALACQKSGCNYFNFAEEFVGNSDLLGAHRSALWGQGFAEDCAEILGSLPGHVAFLRTAFNKAGIPIANDTLFPGPTAYANMQRMVAKYLTPEKSKEVRKKLEDANLPVYGFDNEAKEFMSKRLQVLLAFVFGVIFICVMLVIALLRPEPTSFQYEIFKTVLALAGAGIAAVIPGFIEVRLKGWLRAGGALAVFVVLYFFTAAKLDGSTKNPTAPSTTVQTLTEQKSTDSTCANNVANNGSSINCGDSEKSSEKKAAQTSHQHSTP